MAARIPSSPPLLGILGGMGPLATVDLMNKIILATPVAIDQDHVPMLVANLPQIPPRVAAWERGDDAPLAAMIAGLSKLEAGGATLGVIPCNTAHLWFDAMQAAIKMPLLHIAHCAIDALLAEDPAPVRIGLLATNPTVQSGLYRKPLEAAGFVVLEPDAVMQTRHVLAAIDAIKTNDLVAGAIHAEIAARALIEAGAQRLLLGCTELPLALERSSYLDWCIDPTATLASACVRWWMTQRAELGSLA